MTDLTLTKLCFANGVWNGRLTSPHSRKSAPQIQVLWRDMAVDDVSITQTPDTDKTWDLRIPLPPAAIGDGVQTFLIVDGETEASLGHFTLSGDDVPADNLRAEVELLRAELDMLKRAFRRHCREIT